MRTWPAVLLLLSALLGSETAVQAAAPGVLSREQVETDWLRQDAVRRLPVQRGSVTPEEDAAGGCDGVKDGRYGFHTALLENPWWQVDLGKEMPLHQVLVYNRCDGSPDRAARLLVLLSSDGKEWRKAYQHDGSLFQGEPDKKPLSILLQGAKARFVRIQLPGKQHLHLDEVEVYPTSSNRNVALGKPACQSGTSAWSSRKVVAVNMAADHPLPQVVQRGLQLAESLKQLGVSVEDKVRELKQTAAAWAALPKDAPAETRRKLYFQARWLVRDLAFANPLLQFDSLLFVKRVPTSFTHMSDQNYGWFSRPGGGLYVLEGFRGPSPRLRCLTPQLPPGNIIEPELSYDGGKVLFAWCKHYPGLAELPNKMDKSKIAEDAFYHLHEMKLDGTGLRRLTTGKYDDFDGRYLPNGEIVFLSTRRGQAVQAGRESALASGDRDQPDCYVRCGGGNERPVAVYTLHVMNREGKDPRAISPFENFEWNPRITHDGRIIYSRWDYIDRDNMPYMGLWSTMPDGTRTHAVFGNYTVSPYCVFEAQTIPNSSKIIFTASAHHAITGGSLVLLDPGRGTDGPAPMTRLTPEVPFPEVEGWPATYYANPFPLSEQHYLVAWSDQPLAAGWPRVNPANALGLYLYDAFGNLELIHRDPDISSMYPIPVRPRPRPPVAGSPVQWDAPAPEGRMLLLDVYRGLEGIERGAIDRLRIVGVPAKTQPQMNTPSLGVTRDDPGKFVLGTVPVEKDGSAYFRVPAGVSFFMQALDREGVAVQTMRSVAYVQPGQTYTCAGCHESRTTTPVNRATLATLRTPSRITPGPDGSWPLDFRALIQPMVERQCVKCHQPGADGAAVRLTADHAYETLVSHGGERSLRNHVLTRYRQGRSTAGAGAAQSSALYQLLKEGHYDVKLTRADWERWLTWMDTYAQRTGSFGAEQEQQLRELRQRMAGLLTTKPR